MFLLVVGYYFPHFIVPSDNVRNEVKSKKKNSVLIHVALKISKFDYMRFYKVSVGVVRSRTQTTEFVFLRAIFP
jgi:hypothetical protein